jgi:hypothetical protein
MGWLSNDNDKKGNEIEIVEKSNSWLGGGGLKNENLTNTPNTQKECQQKTSGWKKLFRD